jgi:hypothetical protein
MKPEPLQQMQTVLNMPELANYRLMYHSYLKTSIKSSHGSFSGEFEIYGQNFSDYVTVGEAILRELLPVINAFFDNLQISDASIFLREARKKPRRHQSELCLSYGYSFPESPTFYAQLYPKRGLDYPEDVTDFNDWRKKLQQILVETNQ